MINKQKLIAFPHSKTQFENNEKNYSYHSNKITPKTQANKSCARDITAPTVILPVVLVPGQNVITE